PESGFRHRRRGRKTATSATSQHSTILCRSWENTSILYDQPVSLHAGVRLLPSITEPDQTRHL
ncbi:MAG TPA: hypothetical protein VE710_10935, partial [Candidatus Bathyarchaeia archaeon]|nr:hypothetical protein [Candidatus Bathyarchaeia archaeon]